jgi:ribosomal protein L7/L12
MSLTSEAKKEVERLLQSGQKIQAVKYLHDTFNISLLDAKTLVEAVEREQTPAQPTGEFSSTGFSSSTSSQTALDGPLKAQVKALLISNKKIEAVKLVKTELNTGLKEALVMVEEVHKEVDPNYQSVTIGTGCLGNTFKLMSVIFGFIGLLFLGIAAGIYYFQSKTINNSDLVQGRVIDIQYSGDGAAPVITYVSGGKHRTWSSNTFSKPPAHDLNEQVAMYVNKDDPEDVIVDTFIDRWLLITIFGSIGLVFSLFTIGFMMAGRKF